MPCFTFVASFEAILMMGATPVVVDIDDSLTLDIEAVKAAITPKTKAIMPVHMCGSMANLDALKSICKDNALLLIEDAVYAVNPQHKTYPLIKGVNTFVLQSDLAARGILNRMSPSIEMVDYEGFVDLTSEQENSLTWD